MINKQYSEDLITKRIRKGGGFAPIIAGLSEKKQEEIQMVLNEQWLEGYKTAKEKFKRWD